MIPPSCRRAQSCCSRSQACFAQLRKRTNVPPSVENVLVLGDESAASALNDRDKVGEVASFSRERRASVGRVVGVGGGKVDAEAVGGDVEGRGGEVGDRSLARDSGVVPDEFDNITGKRSAGAGANKGRVLTWMRRRHR